MSKNTPFERFAALYGREHGVYAWIARAVDANQEHVSRCLRGERPVPDEWVALLEFLELIPRDKWPDRWR